MGNLALTEVLLFFPQKKHASSLPTQWPSRPNCFTKTLWEHNQMTKPETNQNIQTTCVEIWCCSFPHVEHGHFIKEHFISFKIATVENISINWFIPCSRKWARDEPYTMCICSSSQGMSKGLIHYKLSAFKIYFKYFYIEVLLLQSHTPLKTVWLSLPLDSTLWWKWWSVATSCSIGIYPTTCSTYCLK